jgi:hypothetical protein
MILLPTILLSPDTMEDFNTWIEEGAINTQTRENAYHLEKQTPIEFFLIYEFISV